MIKQAVCAVKYSIPATCAHPPPAALAATTLDVQLPYALPDNHCSLLLAVGLEMGTVAGGSVEGVRYVGSARILEGVSGERS